jgi:negative regulator of sigma-B (phosphoserine phosphatase)
LSIVGIATKPAPHETANGDRALHVVRDTSVIYGVIDGLGHGPKAEEAALAAIDAIQRSTARDVSGLFTAAHAALRSTRGAAMTLVVVEGTACEAAGVGNVTLRTRLVRGLSLAATPGILGGQMRSLRIARGELERGARLAIWSDGVSSRAPIDDYATEVPEVAARRVLAEHGVAHDDGTILIVDL